MTRRRPLISNREVTNLSTVERAPDGAVEGELHRLHSSVVAPEQIDQLGHMNVRFYGTLAMAASRALAEEFELTRGAGESVQLAYTDMYTRHYREQLEGALLEVRGGILDANETQLRVYHELVNAEREELSATFVHVIQLQDPGAQKPKRFGPSSVKRQSTSCWLPSVPNCQVLGLDWVSGPRGVSMTSEPSV